MKNANSVSLDDPTIFKRLDSDGMLTHLNHFPEECNKARDLAMSFPLDARLAEVDKVVVLGMGGSAIGGDLVSSIAASESRMPVLIYRGYDLPAYVDKRTLVIASSYSGNTEETLSCFEQSIAVGARNLVITTGGKLSQMAKSQGMPVFSFDYAAPPRAALPYSFVALLSILRQLGVMKATIDIEGMMTELKRQRGICIETAPEQSNPAKQIARRLHGRIPVIYGAGTAGEVAHRWKSQLNENSKVCSFYEVLPEMNHNAVVGYEFPDGLPESIYVVMLVSQFQSQRVTTRFNVVRQLLSQAKIGCETVTGKGDSPVAEMMGLILLGDYVSYYLAMLNNVAPGPVTAIDFLKSELSKNR